MLKISLASTLLAASLNIQAETVDLDDVTMEVSTQEVKRGNRLGLPIRSTVLDYMLEKGDITQDEIDAQKESRETQKAELKLLKDSGDQDAFEAKKLELREKRKEDRESLKTYVENNEELKTTITELKTEAQEKRDAIKEKRRELKEKRREQSEAADE